MRGCSYYTYLVHAYLVCAMYKDGRDPGFFSKSIGCIIASGARFKHEYSITPPVTRARHGAVPVVASLVPEEKISKKNM